MQRKARGDDHLLAMVSEGDPRLELAAQVKDSHATFWAKVARVGRLGARLVEHHKWGCQLSGIWNVVHDNKLKNDLVDGCSAPLVCEVCVSGL